MADGIDSAALGEALARHLAPVLQAVVASNQRPAEVEKDEFQETLNAVIEGAADGTVKVNDVLMLLDAHGKKLTKQQKGELQGIVLEERRARAVREIDNEIEKFAEHDELIKENKELIRMRVIHDFDKLPEFDRERQAFAQGYLEPTAIKALTKRHVDRIDKAAERRGNANKDSGISGMNKTDANSTSKKMDENSATTEGLTPAQRDLYASHYGLMARSGKPHADAHKSAMDAAQRRKA